MGDICPQALPTKPCAAQVKRHGLGGPSARGADTPLLPPTQESEHHSLLPPPPPRSLSSLDLSAGEVREASDRRRRLLLYLLRSPCLDTLIKWVHAGGRHWWGEGQT